MILPLIKSADITWNAEKSMLQHVENMKNSPKKAKSSMLWHAEPCVATCEV